MVFDYSDVSASLVCYVNDQIRKVMPQSDQNLNALNILGELKINIKTLQTNKH